MLRRRWPSAGLALVMVLSFPLAAVAGERDSDRSHQDTTSEERSSEEGSTEVPAEDGAKAEVDMVTSDHEVDRVSDKVRDVIRDRVTDKLRDRVTDKVRDREVDRCIQRRVDRICPHDHPIDTCEELADNPRRCVDHHPHDINIRKLIWRLIHAQEWELLVRLLIRLGLP